MNKLLKFITPVLILTWLSTTAWAEFYVPTMDEIENRKANESRCKNYVSSIQSYQKQNLQHQCGLNGTLWNIDKEHQFGWCMNELESAMYAETQKRAEQIEACIKRKTASKNPQNIPQVPKACYHPDPSHKAVKTLYRAYHYSKTIEQPIENGLIRYDYNQDNKEDYVFLELHEQKATAIVCFSEPEGYRRHVTDLEFYAPGDSIEGEQYDIRQDKDILRVVISALMHNVGSSHRSIEYRYDPAKKAFEIIKNEADRTPVYYDGEPAPMPIPATPRLN